MINELINTLIDWTGVGATITGWGLFRISKVNTEIVDINKQDDGHLDIIIKNNSHISSVTFRARINTKKPSRCWKKDEQNIKNAENSLHKIPYLYARRKERQSIFIYVFPWKKESTQRTEQGIFLPYRKELAPKDQVVFSTKNSYSDENNYFNISNLNNILYIFIEQTGEVHKIDLKCKNTAFVGRYKSEIEEWDDGDENVILRPANKRLFATIIDYFLFPYRRFFKRSWIN